MSEPFLFENIIHLLIYIYFYKYYRPTDQIIHNRIFLDNSITNRSRSVRNSDNAEAIRKSLLDNQKFICQMILDLAYGST